MFPSIVCFVSPGENCDVQAQIEPNYGTKTPGNTPVSALCQDKSCVVQILDQAGNDNPKTKGTMGTRTPMLTLDSQFIMLRYNKIKRGSCLHRLFKRASQQTPSS